MRVSTASWLCVPLLAGCPHVVRITEGVAMTADRRLGAEVAGTVGRFVSNSYHAGIAIGLRAGVLIDGDGATAVVGLSVEAQRQPAQRPAGYSEDTAPIFDPPRGLAVRASAHAGTSIGGELAVLWSRGRFDDVWLDDRSGRYRVRWRFSGVGVEVGGELASPAPIGDAERWAAIRAVEEWDAFTIDSRRGELTGEDVDRD